ncbi:MAG: hypothetical protein LHW59_08190 [Candidatus Cloacimonetes bacterium]|nr:hypothetical protein [Candidatus Cloacimonadota bacterium]
MSNKKNMIRGISKKIQWYLKRPKRICSKLNLIDHNFEYLIDWEMKGPLHPDKKFLVLRIPSLPEQGQLSAWSSIAYDCKWCKQNGIIPVIDYEPYTNFDDGRIFQANEWEDIFHQPCDIPTTEIIKSKHVGTTDIGSLCHRRYIVDSTKDRAFYKLELEYIKSNIWFQPQFYKKLEKASQSVICNERKVLGVSVREEFELLKGVGWEGALLHPDEPPITIVLEKTTELMKKWQCDYCFISTRYTNTITLFKEYFGEKLLYIERERIDIDVEYLEYLKGFSVLKTPRERLKYCLRNNKYAQLGQDIRDEYLTEVFILSQCSNLLATKSGASTAAMYWNGGEYENVYFFEDKNSSKTY